MKKSLIIIMCLLITTAPSQAFWGKKKTTQEPTTIIKGAIEENTVLSLDNCLKLALENNPSIKVALRNTEVYKAKIGQARSAYLPTISLSSGMDKSNSVMNTSSPFSFDKDIDTFELFNVSVDQLIYDFGKTSTTINMQKQLYKSSNSELESAKNNVIFNVKEAYYNFLYTLQQKEVMDESVSQYEDLLEQAQAFYEVGTKAKIDVTIALTNLSNAQLSLIKAKNSVNLAKVKLNKAMGLTSAPDYTLKETLQFNDYSLNVEDVLNIAYEHRPEIIAAKAQYEWAKKQKSLSKKVVFPEIKANGSYATGGSDFTDDNGWSVGLNLEIPTFNPYGTKKTVDEAKAVVAREEATVEETKQSIFLEVQQAYLSYVESQQSVPVAEQSVIQAQENYDLASGRYKVGLGTPIEYKEAEIMYRDAKLQHLEALYNYNVALANIEKVIGESL